MEGTLSPLALLKQPVSEKKNGILINTPLKIDLVSHSVCDWAMISIIKVKKWKTTTKEQKKIEVFIIANSLKGQYDQYDFRI